MTSGTDAISMLFGQQGKKQAGADEQEVAEAFKVVFKIIFWIIDHIPYINTWFLNYYSSTIPTAESKSFKDRELTQLSAFSCPSYFTAQQVHFLKKSIGDHYCSLIKKSNEAPEHSLCYSILGVVSGDKTCQDALDQRVNELYRNQTTIHIGAPEQENRPALSPDYISSSLRVFVPIPLKELFIHGPIASNADRVKLMMIITTTRTLTNLHLEVEKTSATYFTAKAHDILGWNQTITVFNLTLMGEKSALTFDEDPWENLKNHPRCTLTYTNVERPDGFHPNETLTFQ